MKKLVSTKNLSHEEWLKYRKQGIGGSDAGAVCGLNPYSSAIRVYLDKTSEEITDIDNESMRQGRDLEEYVASRFCEETGIKVRRANAIFYNEEYPFMFANVDRMIVGSNAGLECKTANIFQSDKWENDEIPPHYLIQCYHYMAVTGAKEWYIAVLILGKEFKYAKITWDNEVIRNLIQLESSFWYEYVVPRVMPDPDGSRASEELISQYFRQSDSSKHIALNGFDDQLKRREELMELINKMETEKKQIEQQVKMYMEDAEVAESNQYRITWKPIQSARIDTAKLKSEQPEIYSKYCKVNQCRRFTIDAA